MLVSSDRTVWVLEPETGRVLWNVTAPNLSTQAELVSGEGPRLIIGPRRGWVIDLGSAIVKCNYGGEGATKSSVANNRSEYLGAVTAMFRRPDDDPENDNWSGAKYLPDGSLDQNRNGVPLAGGVATGVSQGCIACHQGASGGDDIFNHDRVAQ